MWPPSADPKPTDHLSGTQANIDSSMRFRGERMQRFRDNLRYLKQTLQKGVKIDTPPHEINSLYEKVKKVGRLEGASVPTADQLAATEEFERKLETLENAHTALFQNFEEKWQNELKPIQDKLSLTVDSDAKMKLIRELFIQQRDSLKETYNIIRKDFNDFFNQPEIRTSLEAAHRGEDPPADIEKLISDQKEALKEYQEQQEADLKKAYNEAYELQLQVTMMAQKLASIDEMNVNLDPDTPFVRTYGVGTEEKILADRDWYLTNNKTTMYVSNNEITITHRSLGFFSSLSADVDTPRYVNGKPNRMLEDIRQQILLAKAKGASGVTLDASYVTLGHWAAAYSTSKTPERTRDPEVMDTMAMEAWRMGFPIEKIFIKGPQGQKEPWVPSQLRRTQMADLNSYMEKGSQDFFKKSGTPLDLLRNLNENHDAITKDIKEITDPIPADVTLLRVKALLRQNDVVTGLVKAQIERLNELYVEYELNKDPKTPQKETVRMRISEEIAKLSNNLDQQAAFHTALDIPIQQKLAYLVNRANDVTLDPAIRTNAQQEYDEWKATNLKCDQVKDHCITSEKSLNSLRVIINEPAMLGRPGFHH